MWCTWWMPEAGMQTDAGLATAMRISITRLARRLRVERLGLGGTEAVLSDIQLAALAALERHDAMTPGELAEHEKVQPPSMTRVIAVLEERGLVRRAAHPTDRRQVILTVTQQGRDLVQLVRLRREAWLAQRMQELTPEERATLLAAAPILEKLSQSLDRSVVVRQPVVRRRGPASRFPASRTAAGR
jgi:DNA-binding MarR family transcriptional regulator